MNSSTAQNGNQASAEIVERIIRYFHRHFVPIVMRLQRDDDVQTIVISAFVISIRDKWFLITAGHCIEDVEVAISKGYRVGNTYLVDHMGEGAKYKNGVPFDWAAANPVQPFPNSDNDYGVLEVADYYRHTLEANAVQPITEEAWDYAPSDKDEYFMVGSPSELNRPNSSQVEFTTVLIPFRKLASAPPELASNNPNRFYGQLELNGQLESIVGMSGGPIFRWRVTDDGHVKYWLHAIQSTWHPGTEAIAAVVLRPFAGLIGDWLMKNSRSNVVEAS